MRCDRFFPTSTVQGAALWLLGLCLLAACGEHPDVQTMHFNIDPDELSAAVEAPELGIRFQPPSGWAPLSAADVDSVRRVVGLSHEAFELTPRYVFLDAATGSLLSVSTLRLDPPASFEAQVARYGALLAAQFPADSLRQGQYLKDGIHIAQFLLAPEGRVNFKLVFASPRTDWVQFDYIASQASYPGEIRAIESSIGSIQRIH